LEEVASDAPTPSADDRFPKEANSFRSIGLFAALFALNLGYGFMAETLTPSIMGLFFAPALGTLFGLLLLKAFDYAREGKLVAAGLIVLTASGMVGYLATGSYARSMIFPGCTTPLPEPGAQLSEGRVVGYQSDDAIDLKGYLVRGNGAAPRPAVIYFHGNAESAASNVGWANRLAQEHIDVVVAEYRGYGGCSGSPGQDGLMRDGRAAVAAFAAEVGTPPEDMVLFGRSLGTGVASLLAGEGNGRAVLLLSPYSSLRSMASRLVTPPLAALALRDPFDSESALLKTQQPVTIVHGDLDRVIPYSEGQALAEALGDRARLVTLKGYGHNRLFGATGDTIVGELLRLARAR
jgi:pimeloyl-ACP methyl ester carboxylesterase